jgi:hypothetical protein
MQLLAQYPSDLEPFKLIAALTESGAESRGILWVLRDDLSFLDQQGTGRGGNGSGDQRGLKAVLDKQAKFFPGGISPTFFPGVQGKGG